MSPALPNAATRGQDPRPGRAGVPAVAVAIATYNRAAMVVEAIEAALSQTLRPSEIVVADDASTDGTWQRLTALAARYPELRPVRRQTNSGGVGNWNLAIGQTRAGYIAWCSDDDRFLDTHLAASVEYLERHPEAGLVHSGFVDALEGPRHTERVARRLRFPGPRMVDRRGLLAYLTRYYDWPFHPSTIVMRREVWERTGPFDARYALADTDWFVRAAERFPVVLLARHGVVNRRHTGNWSNRVGSARMQGEIFEIVERLIARLWPEARPAHVIRRAAWRLVWRSNVRLRLALTLAARLRGGHGEAACAAWRQMLEGTGRRAPRRLAAAGLRLIRWWMRPTAEANGPEAPAAGVAGDSIRPL